MNYKKKIVVRQAFQFRLFRKSSSFLCIQAEPARRGILKLPWDQLVKGGIITSP